MTGSWDNTVRLWDVKTGEMLRVFTHTDLVSSVTFSPDSRYILAGSRDKTAYLWDIETKKVHKFTHTDWVSSVAFSSDSRYFMTGSCDKTACLWNVKTGEMVHKFTGHTHWVSSVAFSSNSRYVLTGSRDKTARLWDISEIKKVDDLLNQINLSQLYLLMLIDDALKKGTRCEFSLEMESVFNSFDPKIKKILNEIKEPKSCTIV